MSGILVPLKYITYRSNKMTDGINLTGFNELKPAGTNNLDLNGQQDAGIQHSAFPATDKSTQDGSGRRQRR
jgi:hypothetical protein